MSRRVQADPAVSGLPCICLSVTVAFPQEVQRLERIKSCLCSKYYVSFLKIHVDKIDSVIESKPPPVVKRKGSGWIAQLAGCRPGTQEKAMRFIQRGFCAAAQTVP